MILAELDDWKIVEIDRMALLITEAITAGALSGWEGQTTTAIAQVTGFINGINYDLVSQGVDVTIKNNLPSMLSYIAVKYLTLIVETPEKFPVTDLIAPGVVYTDPDDFRNVFSSYKTLPTLNMSYFDFMTEVGTLTVLKEGIFTTLETDIETTQGNNDKAFWNSIPTTIQSISKDKLLYLMWAKPPTISTLIDPKTFLLNNMHFKESINGAGLQDSFIVLFPELAQ